MSNPPTLQTLCERLDKLHDRCVLMETRFLDTVKSIHALLAFDSDANLEQQNHQSHRNQQETDIEDDGDDEDNDDGDHQEKQQHHRNRRQRQHQKPRRQQKQKQKQNTIISAPPQNPISADLNPTDLNPTDLNPTDLNLTNRKSANIITRTEQYATHAPSNRLHSHREVPVEIKRDYVAHADLFPISDLDPHINESSHCNLAADAPLYATNDLVHSFSPDEDHHVQDLDAETQDLDAETQDLDAETQDLEAETQDLDAETEDLDVGVLDTDDQPLFISLRKTTRVSSLKRDWSQIEVSDAPVVTIHSSDDDVHDERNEYQGNEDMFHDRLQHDIVEYVGRSDEIESVQLWNETEDKLLVSARERLQEFETNNPSAQNHESCHGADGSVQNLLIEQQDFIQQPLAQQLPIAGLDADPFQEMPPLLSLDDEYERKHFQLQKIQQSQQIPQTVQTLRNPLPDLVFPPINGRAFPRLLPRRYQAAIQDSQIFIIAKMYGYFAQKIPLGILLLDPHGTGKTARILALSTLILFHNPTAKILVLCSRNAQLCWEGEIERWQFFPPPDPKIYVEISWSDLRDMNSAISLWSEAGGILLVSPLKFVELSQTRYKENFFNPGPDVAVLDDAHAIPSHIPLFEAISQFKTTRRIVCSGSPLLRSLFLHWQLINFVAPGLIGSYAEFQTVYECPIIRGLAPQASDYAKSSSRALHAALLTESSQYIIRNDLNVNCISMALFRETILRFPLSNPQRLLYKRLVTSRSWGAKDMPCFARLATLVCNHADILGEYWRKKSDGGYQTVDKGSADLEVYLANMTQTRFSLDWICGIQAIQAVHKAWKSTKLFILCHLLARIQEKNRHSVIVTQSQLTLGFIHDAVLSDPVLKARERYNYFRFDNDTSIDRRAAMLRQIRDSRAPTIVLISNMTAEGIDMSHAERLILFDSALDSAQDMSAISRVYRIGQRRNTTVYRFVCTETVEDYLASQRTGLKLPVWTALDERKVADVFRDRALPEAMISPSEYSSRPILQQSHFDALSGDSILHSAIRTLEKQIYIQCTSLPGFFDGDEIPTVTSESLKEALAQIEQTRRLARGANYTIGVNSDAYAMLMRPTESVFSPTSTPIASTAQLSEQSGPSNRDAAERQNAYVRSGHPMNEGLSREQMSDRGRTLATPLLPTPGFSQRSVDAGGKRPSKIGRS